MLYENELARTLPRGSDIKIVHVLKQGGPLEPPVRLKMVCVDNAKTYEVGPSGIPYHEIVRGIYGEEGADNFLIEPRQYSATEVAGIITNVLAGYEQGDNTK